MPTRGNGTAPAPSVGDAAKQVADHAKALVGLEVELASVELKRKAGALGAGAALLAVGGVLALYGLGFVFATVASALDSFMPRWLSLLVVGLVLLGIAGVLALVGLRRMQRGTPPTPEHAIREAKLTTQAIKSDGDV
jgi:uncharacterized membrane protein YqjE